MDDAFQVGEFVPIAGLKRYETMRNPGRGLGATTPPLTRFWTNEHTEHEDVNLRL